jgi:hypothetical protein
MSSEQGGYGKGSRKGIKNSNKMGGKDSSYGGPNPTQSTIHIQLEKDLQLRTTENKYIVKKYSSLELNETEELLREVRNILNKLTPQNLQKLTSDLIQLQINNEERLKGAIDIIFEKVCLILLSIVKFKFDFNYIFNLHSRLMSKYLAKRTLSYVKYFQR